MFRFLECYAKTFIPCEGRGNAGSFSYFGKAKGCTPTLDAHEELRFRTH